MISVKPLDEVKSESYSHFSCGNPDLDIYLKTFAKQNHKSGIGKSFVALNQDLVIGFYTISMASIEFKDVPEEFKKGRYMGSKAIFPRQPEHID